MDAKNISFSRLPIPIVSCALKIQYNYRLQGVRVVPVMSLPVVTMATMLTVFQRSGFAMWIVIVLIILMNKIVVSFKSVYKMPLKCLNVT